MLLIGSLVLVCGLSTTPLYVFYFMEVTKEIIIYKNLVLLNNEIKNIPINESQRRKILSWGVKVSIELKKLFGQDSIHYKTFRNTWEELKPSNKLNPASISEKIQLLHTLVEDLERFNNSKNPIQISYASKIPNSKNIFIIHGHDELNTRRLINLIQNDFHLNPIVIFQKPGQSKSLIDKVENNAQTCSFAFAIFTRDDEVKKEKELYFQARPNVIFETGWFTGRLGKSRLVILLQNGVKIYSDFDGISRIQFENSIEEKYKEIKNELEAAKLI